MKDISVRSIPHGTVYKDVVIIGNGPSGISLSFMLAGNWPYWNAETIQKHPDEMLKARLNYADNSKSLVKQDLTTLADGLEGRSTNPVSLLLDSLEHPCADLGMELPSMLEYRFDPRKQIDHIVLGKGPPGGSWHRMDPNLRTLSLAGWMSLPGLSYSDWESIQQRQKCLQYEMNYPSYLRKMALANTTCPKCIKLRSAKQVKSKIENIVYNNNEFEPEALCCKCTKKICNGDSEAKPIDTTNEVKLVESSRGIVHSPPRRNLSLRRQVSKEVQTRALVSRVAKYYEDYVHHMNLDRFFMNSANVTYIAPLSEDCVKSRCFQEARWIVTGIDESTKRAFYFACKNLVLANGVSDLPNRLGLRGELNGTNRSWVKHDLRELETALENLSEVERKDLKPILVIGAGLSAADAVTICRSSDIDVIHVYRSKSAGLDRSLPENVYPEYHEVHKMMNDPNQKYNCYTPVPEHTISNLFTDDIGNHFVCVRNLKTSETTTYEVSYCAILIGARPNLRFLSNLGKRQMKSKTSPKSSHEHIDQCQNHMTRRLAWFKSICEKCKHFNICEWNRRLTPIELRNRICGHSTSQPYECERLCSNDDSNIYQTDDSGIGLGIESLKPIDSKTNQIDVNKYTNEIQGLPEGIFAMGPLVGDNFVRFIPGGALAITSTLHQEND